MLAYTYIEKGKFALVGTNGRTCATDGAKTTGQ